MSNSIRREAFLSGMIQTLGLKTYCEVGCRAGRTMAYLLEQNPELRAVGIDPWVAQPANEGVEGRETYQDWDFAKIEAEFGTNLAPFMDRALMLRTTSEAAAARLPGPFDIVFIDALHDQDSVLADIARWQPKVRPGGVLAGHDYQHKHRGVMRAVAEAFNLMDVGVGPDSVWFVKVD